MNILITGASGIIGSACQRTALTECIDTTIISSKESIDPRIRNFQSFNQIIGSNLNVYDLIIHSAGSTPFNTEYNQIYDCNEKIDNVLCELINICNVKHVIYLSSMAVYGEINEEVINENTLLNKPNIYGLSKLNGEKHITKACSENKTKLSILRLPGVVAKKMRKVFFRNLYESIQNGKQIKIRSRESLFNNAVLDTDIFYTALNLYKSQDNQTITLNHHSKDQIRLGDLLDEFSKTLGKVCIFKESIECNPPFLITNTSNDDYLIKTNIRDMLVYYHSSI